MKIFATLARGSLLAYTGLFFAFIYIPLALIAAYSFNANPVNMMTWTGFTTEWYAQVLGFKTTVSENALYLESTDQLVQALWNSLKIAASTTAIATVLGTAMAIAWGMGASKGLVLALSTKSVTTALATVLANQVGANAALAASIVLVTGLLGAAIGPWLFARILPHDDATLGVALGTCAHAIGTSRALQISETCSAFSALAMAVNGLLTAALLPMLLSWLGG